MYTLDNITTAQSYSALSRRGFTNAQMVEYYNFTNPMDRKKMFARLTQPQTAPKITVSAPIRQICSNQLVGTQKCTVDVDSVRDMALDYIERTWTVRGRDFKLTDMGWKFKFNDRKNANGLCSPRNRTIYLSTYVIENATREMSGWINTMVHEIAHAINHHLGGRGHDRQWKSIFLQMGGSGERCSSDVVFENLIKNPISKYTTICPNGHTKPSHKRSRLIEQGRQACGKCCKELNGGKYTSAYNLTQIKNY